MVYTAVAGKGSRQLCGELYTVLGKLCGVARVEDALLAATGETPDVLLWQCRGEARLRVSGGVLVLAPGCGELEGLQTPSDCVVIADTADEDSTRFAAARGLRLLDCGLSSKASLTFSSIGRGAGAVSLQREILDLAGNRLEPLDLPLGIEPTPYYPVLAAVGVLLLAGRHTLLETLSRTV